MNEEEEVANYNQALNPSSMGTSLMASSIANPTIIEEVEPEEALHKITVDEAYVKAGGWGRF
jgi:hypothetical protein